MKREISKFLSDVVDSCIPPIIREQHWFYRPLLKLVVKGDVDGYLDFRNKAWQMTPEEMQSFYASIYSNIKRPTDCNAKSIKRVLEGIVGKDVLEFGCGRGFLAENILKLKYNYVGIDFDISPARRVLGDDVTLFNGFDLSILPEKFYVDTVISTHTLEHLIDLRKIVRQLVAVAKHRVIIVVPLQMNLKYTPDLHTRFWRVPGDFLLSAGFKHSDSVKYWIDNGDLCVFINTNKR